MTVNVPRYLSIGLAGQWLDNGWIGTLQHENKRSGITKHSILV